MIGVFKKYVSLAIIHLFNLLPIKNNKVFFFSYYGSQYGCNPKYITEYILRHYPKEKFDIVWALNKPNAIKRDFRTVKTMSIRYFYELSTSKVIITNFRTTDLFVKRKDQYYIQTWHSSLRLKQIERDAESVLPEHYVEMAKKDSQKCDLLLSGCAFSTNIFKGSFWYDGEIFEHGTPRNDLLFQNDDIVKNRILNGLNIPSDTKIILYAPTFRKNNSLEVYNLDYTQIIERCESKFGEKWLLLVKLHPHLVSKSNQLIYKNQVKDVTSYDDIQELLTITDVLITDYSSLMFDFSLSSRPCFLYVPDLEEYVKNDRNLYFDIEDLPFIHATTNKELLNCIDRFSDGEYQKKITEFSGITGTYEDGKACEHLLKQINEVCFSENWRNHNEAI